MVAQAGLTPEEARARIGAHPLWYHRIELVSGVFTPGSHDSQGALIRLDALGLPYDLSGQRVLDVGCRDGFFSFELERRGATVVGVDYAEPTATGFSIASEILGSRVEYLTENVYDLTPEKHGRFHLILFLGVLYHLRNPLLALDRLRDVAMDDSEIFVETQLTTEDELRSSDTPMFEFLPRDQHKGDATNMWAPNGAGLAAALEECQFDVIAEAQEGGRGWLRARAVTDTELERFRRLDASRGVWGQT